LVLLSALWCRYCLGISESGTVIAPNDPNWGRLAATAAAARDKPQAWLDMAEVYGDMGAHPALAVPFARALRDVHARGSRAVIADYLANA
jgi:mannitol 2-dehydrogenase